MNRRNHLLPCVYLNAAMSADGKLAPPNRRFAPFAGKADETWLHELRSRCDAILCGATTLSQGGFTMGAGGEVFRKKRLERGLARDAIRIVVSGSASIDPGAPIFNAEFSPILLLTTRAAPPVRVKLLREKVAAVHVSQGSVVDIPAALSWLRKEWGVRSLVCEGGGMVYGSFLQAGVVDHVHLTLAPVLIGGRAAPTIGDAQGPALLAESPRFQLTSVKVRGGSLFTSWRRRTVPGPP